MICEMGTCIAAYVNSGNNFCRGMMDVVGTRRRGSGGGIATCNYAPPRLWCPILHLTDSTLAAALLTLHLCCVGLCCCVRGNEWGSSPVTHARGTRIPQHNFQNLTCLAFAGVFFLHILFPFSFLSSSHLPELCKY